jgi:hypothetical protein
MLCPMLLVGLLIAGTVRPRMVDGDRPWIEEMIQIANAHRWSAARRAARAAEARSARNWHFRQREA